jgi:hypothetical protein
MIQGDFAGTGSRQVLESGALFKPKEAAMDNYIKRSVTIYSFKEMVSEGRLGWDECISKIVNLGITGAELLGQLYFRECPEVNKDDLAAWKKIMATVTAFYWNYGHLATVIIDLPGGLDENKSHDIYFKYNLRTYYLPFQWGGEATLTLDAVV